MPSIPMQKEWHPPDRNLTATALQYEYRAGDLVSYYNPASRLVTGGTVPAQEIWQCTSDVQVTAASPAAQKNFKNLFQCRAIKNSPDSIAFPGDARSTFPAFRTDPSLLISAPAIQQAYFDEHREDNSTVEGLININTADWKVLSTLPLVVNPQTGLPDDQPVPGYPSASVMFPNGAYSGNPVTFRVLNQEMAKAIEYYRDVNANPASAATPTAPFQPHGPFRSIFDLNQVVDLRPRAPGTSAGMAIPGTSQYPANTLAGFRNGYWTMPLPVGRADEAGDALGDLSPADTGGTNTVDNIRGDYEEQNLQLTRISNMITTRSDSFTCYILVQGWRNAETANAQLVVQRRVGYLMDRSRVTPLTPDAMSIEPFPNN
jgi:hypothetical protein